jgi:PPK2 family polyphosphate:nucleotide phosphotransferase
MHPTFLAHSHRCLVPFDGEFSVADAPTKPGEKHSDSNDWKDKLEKEKEAIGRWQHKLYADGRFAVLLVFQAMDAGGKDSTIRHVLTGVNPTGLRVTSFKAPSSAELAHDFLWRTTAHLPSRGELGVFNRSHYEEVLVVRARPELLAHQNIALPVDRNFWQARFRAINDHERQLAEAGTLILKFWLNVSKEEQRRRLLGRIDRPHKRWKFRAGDLNERALWDQYMRAYEACLNATSQPWAPWYAIPADHKPYMRWQVAKLINDALEQLGVDFPQIPPEEISNIDAAAQQLRQEPM